MPSMIDWFNWVFFCFIFAADDSIVDGVEGSILVPSAEVLPSTSTPHKKGGGAQDAHKPGMV